MDADLPTTVATTCYNHSLLQSTWGCDNLMHCWNTASALMAQHCRGWGGDST